MARRGGFRTQAPKEVTVLISGVLWLLGLLNGLGVFALPNNLGFGGAHDQIASLRSPWQRE